MTVDVAIVGGGISGLTTAYRLKRAGLDVVVLERRSGAGGNAVSERINGFLMEHGPSTVAADSEAALGLSENLGIGGGLRPLSPDIRRRYLVSDGALTAIPAGPLGFFRSNYLSPGGRLRLLAEPWVRRRPAATAPEESVAAFCRRRFGAEFADRVMDPLVGGIYAGDAEALSVAALFPKLVGFEKEYGSVTLGMARAARTGRRMPGSRLMSWQDGVGTLPRALAADLGRRVRCGVAVRSLRRDRHGFTLDAGGDGAAAASLVLAVQPHVAAGLLDGIDEAAAAAAAAISAPPLAVVFLGYRRADVDHPLDSLGYLAARSEGRAVNGVQFASTMFPGRAPEGHVALSAYVGGARRPDLARLPAAELIDLAEAELRDLVGIRGKPVVSRVAHWPVGIPQYERGHRERVSVLDGTADRVAGLHVTGNFLSGPSIAACIGKASETALRIAGERRARAGRVEGIGAGRTIIPGAADPRRSAC